MLFLDPSFIYKNNRFTPHLKWTKTHVFKNKILIFNNL